MKKVSLIGARRNFQKLSPLSETLEFLKETQKSDEVNSYEVPGPPQTPADLFADSMSSFCFLLMEIWYDKKSHPLYLSLFSVFKIVSKSRPTRAKKNAVTYRIHLFLLLYGYFHGRTNRKKKQKTNKQKLLPFQQCQ